MVDVFSGKRNGGVENRCGVQRVALRVEADGGEPVLAPPTSYARLMTGKIDGHLRELDGWRQDKILTEAIGAAKAGDGPAGGPGNKEKSAHK